MDNDPSFTVVSAVDGFVANEITHDDLSPEGLQELKRQLIEAVESERG